LHPVELLLEDEPAEENVGQQSQSMDPVRETSAAVSQSPINP